MKNIPLARVQRILDSLETLRVLVIGDIMLDQFIWGSVRRISPEAPVPVVEFERESFMPGGAANVARNLTCLKARTSLLSVIGRDPSAKMLRSLLIAQNVECSGLVSSPNRPTSVKTRIIAHQQQMVRVDRETTQPIDANAEGRLLAEIHKQLPEADAVIVGDYGKGVITQSLLNKVKDLCRARGKWLSLDPKPVHHLDLAGLSLITPNRKEAFELAGIPDGARHGDPLKDTRLMAATSALLERLAPALLLITLGDLGMLLCRRNDKPIHIPTVAQEVFDVSGAGDTVIASFTLAIAAGASPLEAAIFSNHAAGVVVGKVGTASVTQEELLKSFSKK